MVKRSNKLDINQLAKRIVDEAISNKLTTPSHFQKNKIDKDKRRLYGSKGGIIRANKLAPEQRKAIAKLAASTRWHKID